MLRSPRCRFSGVRASLLLREGARIHRRCCKPEDLPDIFDVCISEGTRKDESNLRGNAAGCLRSFSPSESPREKFYF